MNLHEDEDGSAPGSADIAGDDALLQDEIARLIRECQDEQAGNRVARLETLARIAQAMVDEIRRLRAAEQEQRRVVSILHASSSWRITSPLRAISYIWHSVRHGSASTRTRARASHVQTPARPPSKTMLVIADMPPLYDQQSGALRLSTVLELLQEAGWSLAFGSYLSRPELPDALISIEGKSRYEGALRAVGVQRLLYGEAEIGAYLDEPDTQIDWAFLSYPSVASRFMPLVRTRFPGARIAFDMVDFHSLRIERQAELTSDAARFAEARRTRDQEIALALAADVTIAITPQEKEAVLALAPTATVKVLPCIFDVATREPPELDLRHGIFFIGNFLHSPNGDSIHWFVECIWPLIRAQEPTVELSIAGSGMTDDILALGRRPGIRALGYIPDVPPLLDRHRVFVAPLRYGAGMKGKVGQSMANGLPVVATRIGAEGMDLVHGKHILVADGESAFAAEVLRLLHDDNLWHRLSRHGQEHIGRTLSRSAVRTQITDIFGP